MKGNNITIAELTKVVNDLFKDMPQGDREFKVGTYCIQQGVVMRSSKSFGSLCDNPKCKSCRMIESGTTTT